MIPHSRPWITEADRRAVDDALASGLVAQGDGVERFEAAAARSLNAVGAVAAASGTAALVLALRALRLRAGGEVVVPTYVCESVAQAVVAAGLVPVPCDVGGDWVMNRDTVAAVLSPRTVAVMAVHLYGIACDADALGELGLPVIEDACQAWGATLRGRPVGTLAAVGVVSTHGTKCLTTGEGGVAVATDPELVARLRALRDGEGPASPRTPAPMSDLQAALGCSQLARYDAFLAHRERLGAAYFHGLRECDVELPERLRGAGIFFRFPILARGGFDETRAAFARRGVAVRRGVDCLLHRGMGLDPARFPVAEDRFARTVSIPLYPALGDDERDRVIESCREIWR